MNSKLTLTAAAAIAVIAALVPTEAAQAATCAPISVQARVVLGGAFNQNTGLMSDSLRTGATHGLAVLPASEPYSDLGYVMRGGTGASADLGDPATTSPDAIVDWVLVELRSPDNPQLLIASDAVTVQRDGDLSRPAAFAVPPGDYFVAIQHRNHLGVMTEAPVSISTSETPLVDFASPATPVWDRADIAGVDYEGVERWDTGTGIAALWWGDADGNGQVLYQGIGNDPSAVEVAVLADPDNTFASNSYISRRYQRADVNLDGAAIYQGQNNDVDPIFNAIALFPLNTTNDAAYSQLYDQVPDAVLGENLSASCAEPGPTLAATGAAAEAAAMMALLGTAGIAVGAVLLGLARRRTQLRASARLG